ncbi:MAG: outer membrane protein assembly factor BamB [Comamonas sp.]|nr:outer membrane protein assembly factor BamB [Comamonas sp.]
MASRTTFSIFVRSTLAAVVLASLAACGSKPPQPAELGPNVVQLPVRQVWQAAIPELKTSLLEPLVIGQQVLLASADGTVVSLDASSGQQRWQARIGQPLSSGLGSDGRHSAAVTQNNRLVVLRDGQVQWQQPLDSAVYTTPLVAGERVFVLTAQRHIQAYDAADGQLLWTLPRDGEPLVLRQPGVLMAHGNTLLAGLSGRLVAINPDNGGIFWEVPIAAPRGTNDVERLVDLVAPVVRDGNIVCARAFQASLGCVDVERAQLLWAAPAKGANGIAADAQQLYGAESNGVVQAWSRDGGSKQWTQTSLRHRQLTAPLSLGRSVVVGDSTGLVHLFSKQDGNPVNRLMTDASGIVTTPVVAADTLVVVSRKGQVYGFRPD